MISWAGTMAYLSCLRLFTLKTGCQTSMKVILNKSNKSFFKANIPVNFSDNIRWISIFWPKSVRFWRGNLCFRSLISCGSLQLARRAKDNICNWRGFNHFRIKRLVETADVVRVSLLISADKRLTIVWRWMVSCWIDLSWRKNMLPFSSSESALRRKR